MQITCGECRTTFRIDPAKVPPAGIRARCSACGGVIPIGLPGWADAISGPDWASQEHVAVESDAEAAPEEFVEVGGVAHRGVSESRSVTPPVEPARPAEQKDPDDWWWGSSTRSASPRTAGSPVASAPWIAARTPAPVLRGPAVPPAPRTTAVAATSGSVRGVEPGQAPVVHPPAVRPIAVPSAASNTAGVAPVSPVVQAPPVVPAIAPAMPAAVAAVPVEPARPAAQRINPFLRSDPQQRARRLANALVSDILAYHPTELAAARAAGTLRASLREEIQKSYEEYVDQVGGPLAESTPYFRDALNTILAEGHPVF